ncbi:iron complex transport system permease protein [Clostridium sp. DSM 8431]|uniref:iron chelate uptake ABC transporter family permease subunit n=1 Tax=Clostridium sp. DSM 8431 TaxID=1761781 RepID=UPI0008E0BC32|nr:iron chelate uptake ABC transporter family permease subunit [Clostridium sp. DSM 8431]SFU77198.1 iron complex transport system permease protein [Clostridium sp. DSM 8431]
MQLNTKEKKELKKIYALLIIAVISTLIFLCIGLEPSTSSYLLSKRIPKILAIIVSGGCIAFSAIVFQTITNNRILTPSILGLDSVYSFFQTIVVFIFGSQSIVMTNKNINFILSLIGMLFLSAILYKLVFKRYNNLMHLLLVGLIVGTLFNSMASFMQVLIDPNEYLTLQTKLVASFSNVNVNVLLLSILILLGIIPFIYDDFKFLDVITLGREQVLNLGVDYDKIVKKMMLIIAILTAISTALVGPVTFLSLIVVNVTYQVIHSYKHTLLTSAAVLISVCSLVIGTLLVEKVFTFNTTLSIIINFIGGIYFLYLLLKENKL